MARGGNPAYAAQPIISVPPESDNLRQTIVAPPRIKLDRNVPLPNIVAFAGAPLPAPPITEINKPKLPALSTLVVEPPPEIARTERYQLPELPQSPVAPAPEIRGMLKPAMATQPAVVGPPPAIVPAAMRSRGDMNIAPADVIAPAPQLPVASQRPLAPMAQSGSVLEVVTPPPAIAAPAGRASGGPLI